MSYPPQGSGASSKEVWEYLNRVLTNLPDARAALIDLIPTIEHSTEWSSDPIVTNVAVAAETELAEHTLAAADFVYPEEATEIRVILLTMITAQAQVAPILAPHHIGVKVQIEVNDGGWNDIDGMDFTADPPFGLAVEGAMSTWSFPINIADRVESGDKLDFRFAVESTDAADVNYTTSFVVVLIYKMG